MYVSENYKCSGTTLGLGSATDMRPNIETSSLIGWARQSRTDRDEHAMVQADSSLSNRRASLSLQVIGHWCERRQKNMPRSRWLMYLQ